MTDAPRPMTPLGVYVHVPFCAVRCPSCDFNTYTTGAGRGTYAGAAAQEVATGARALGDDARPVETVFFGGGTPTLLDPRDLGRILGAVRDELGLAPGAEITVEANPDSVGPGVLTALREMGATRVSIGMQSGVEHVLAFLGRTHAPGRAAQAAIEARRAGFEHVSLDLIYGSPVESDDDWRRSLESALEASPDHLSAYGLTVEPGTRLAAQVRRGAVPPPQEEAMAARYLIAEERLAAAGLHWYEVCSWAAGQAARCRHNEGYWRGDDWLGIGPGAHSHVAGRRWWNVRRPASWASRVEHGRSTAEGGEALEPGQRHLERLITEVRTRAGLPVDETTAPRATTLARDGLLEAGALEDGRAVLTLRGRLVADLVTRRLAA